MFRFWHQGAWWALPAATCMPRVSLKGSGPGGIRAWQAGTRWCEKKVLYLHTRFGVIVLSQGCTHFFVDKLLEISVG